MIDFIGQWVIFFVGIMFAMSVDNIFWIPTSPEWKGIKKNFWIIIFWGNEYCFPKNKEGLNYCWKNRIFEVLKHPRDIFPGLITSFILAVIL